ncbi:unnamed protein product [Lactuca saligna]|uniref:DEAD-box helicase OB fold domain-containing protein n=1 Tax=Lactuca saligna TaxID=75948 RepID=A0AA35ZK30_LACSI|nr:unnamed protein product [Lactuca saligna]
MGFNLIEFLLLSICGSEKQGAVLHNENSFLLKNVADDQNSVNSRALRIPFPWLVFDEKIKANSVFLLDTTVVSDSVMLLFVGSISKGDIESLLPFLTPFLFDPIPFHDMK